MRFLVKSLIPAICLLSQAHGASVLANNNFQAFSIIGGNYNSAYNVTTNPDGYLSTFGGSPSVARQYLQSATNMGWQTTGEDNLIEIWRSGMSGVPSPEGTQFAEINATVNAALFQDVTIDTAGQVEFAFLHRGRAGTDTLQVLITYLGEDNTFGTIDDELMVDKQYSTGNTAWAEYTEFNQFTSVADGMYRFSFGAVSTAGGNLAAGNFIDNVRFGVGAVPEPSSVLLSAFGVLGLLRRRR